MTSRPAAPESETPEVDALFEEFINAGGEKDVIDYHAIMRKLDLLARSLECRLCLAQTEIKGHVRNESDLLNELALARADWACAQARIAELEKALASVPAASANPAATWDKLNQWHLDRAALKDRA